MSAHTDQRRRHVFGAVIPRFFIGLETADGNELRSVHVAPLGCGWLLRILISAAATPPAWAKSALFLGSSLPTATSCVMRTSCLWGMAGKLKRGRRDWRCRRDAHSASCRMRRGPSCSAEEHAHVHQRARISPKTTPPTLRAFTSNLPANASVCAQESAPAFSRAWTDSSRSFWFESADCNVLH